MMQHKYSLCAYEKLFTL